MTQKEKQSAWRKNNPEKHREQQARYRKKHADRDQKKAARWYRENTARKRATSSAWSKNNPTKKKSYRSKRRTAATLAGGSFTAQEWVDLCSTYKDKCLGCNKVLPLEPDHVIPVILGGTSNIDNIQPLCRTCNARKRTGTTDFRAKS